MIARTVGGEALLRQYKTRLCIAERLLKGKLNEREELSVDELLSPTIMKAAITRLGMFPHGPEGNFLQLVHSLLDVIYRKELAGHFDRDFLLLVENLTGYEYNPENEDEA